MALYVMLVRTERGAHGDRRSTDAWFATGIEAVRIARERGHRPPVVTPPSL